MNPVVAIIAGVGVGTLVVFGLAVIDAYAITSVIVVDSGNTAPVYDYLAIGIFAALAVIVISTVARLQ